MFMIVMLFIFLKLNNKNIIYLICLLLFFISSMFAPVLRLDSEDIESYWESLLDMRTWDVIDIDRIIKEYYNIYGIKIYEYDNMEELKTIFSQT